MVTYAFLAHFLNWATNNNFADRIISLGKQAKVLFTLTHSLPHVQTHPGDVFYIVGVLVGLILWGFAIVWFVVAVMMLAVSGGFPFNMGWWGFIFPVGRYRCLNSVLTA